MDYVIAQKINKATSFVIGDRESDVLLARKLNLGAIQIGADGVNSWADIAKIILNAPRRSCIQRKPTIITIDNPRGYQR